MQMTPYWKYLLFIGLMILIVFTYIAVPTKPDFVFLQGEDGNTTRRTPQNYTELLVQDKQLEQNETIGVIEQLVQNKTIKILEKLLQDDQMEVIKQLAQNKIIKALQQLIQNNTDGVEEQAMSPTEVYESEMDLDPEALLIEKIKCRNQYKDVILVEKPLTMDDLFPEKGIGDRILKQQSYIPPGYNDQDDKIRNKSILIFAQGNRLADYEVVEGTTNFQGCPVSRCTILTKVPNFAPDAVIYKHKYYNVTIPSSSSQVKIYFTLESPLNIGRFENPSIINWTLTYRFDSDIVEPYAYWIYNSKEVEFKMPETNYAANKTKEVVWFASNCHSKKRLEYVRSLSNFIPIDIFGKCGNSSCPRTPGSTCREELTKQYKFYLAFENSNCIDYVTEKVFRNSFGTNVIPVVMGASREFYKTALPYNSYIHVEDFSGPEDLAAYLKKVDADDNLYNSYFKWKGTGKLIDTRFWCRICAMLHGPYKEKSYKDINTWMRTSTCVNDLWDPKYRKYLDL